MFDFLEVETKQPRIVFGGRKNKSLGYSMMPAAWNEHELQFLLEGLPARWLEIFDQKPYCDLDWISLFQRPSPGRVNRETSTLRTELPLARAPV
jgi:hypothetical protein